MKRSRLGRGVVLALAVVGLAAGTTWGQGAARETARGVVFEDRDRDGVRDAGEPGVAGVRVSNGETFATTDAEGKYSIEVGSDTTLWVVKPRDYMTRVDGLNMPRFYHHHVPAGTQDGKYLFKGIAATGPLPASVDFPLYPRPEGEKFRVVLFGDPQAYTTQEMNWYARDVVAEFARLRREAGGVAFGVALGDLVGDNLALFAPYNEANALAGFTWYNVIGNHDLNFEAPDDVDADAPFRATFGPSTYIFQHGRAHFVILNNVWWNGFRGYRRDGWPQRGNYEGRIRERDLKLIEAYLKNIPTEDAVVVCTHIPMQVMPQGEDASVTGRDPTTLPTSRPSPQAWTPEFGKLLAILSGRPNTMSVSGHTHFHKTYINDAGEGFTAPGGAAHVHHNVSTISGTWYSGQPDERGVPIAMQRDGTPRGYAVAEFDGPKFTVQYRPLGRLADEQMRLDLPDVVTRAGAGASEVWANFYAGSERCRLRMRVKRGDGWTGAWVEMKQARRADALYAALHAASVEWAGAEPGRRALNAPIATDHHWVASLPAELEPALYSVEVEATDLYGAVFRAERPVRVVSAMSDYSDIDRTSIRTPRAGSPAAQDAARATTRPSN